MKSSNFLILVLWLAFSSSSVLASQNGASRGGGNAVVCFKSVETANLFKIFDSTTHLPTGFRPITTEILAETDPNNSQIESIEMLDLKLAKEERGLTSHTPINPLYFLDASGVNINDQNSLEIFLDQKYYELISRVKDTLPQIYLKLVDAGKQLALEDILIEKNGLNSVFDVRPIGQLEAKCILSTVIVQAGELGGQPIWHIDPRIFFHPKFGRINQVVAVLHERIHLIGRSYGKKDSYDATLFISHLLRQNVTVAEILTSFQVLTDAKEFNYDQTSAGQFIHRIREEVRNKYMSRKRDLFKNWIIEIFRGVEYAVVDYPETVKYLLQEVETSASPMEFIYSIGRAQIAVFEEERDFLKKKVKSNREYFIKNLQVRKWEFEKITVETQIEIFRDPLFIDLVSNLKGFSVDHQFKIRRDLLEKLYQGQIENFKIDLNFRLP